MPAQISFILPTLAPGAVSAPPVRSLALNITREGEQTESQKVALLMDSRHQVAAYFFIRNGVSQTQTFPSEEIDGIWTLLVTDQTTPPRAAARMPVIQSDLTLNIDLNDRVPGPGGTPARIAAAVRVDGIPADRELVAVERQNDGIWRLAGSSGGNEDAIDLRVTGGDVYVLALDEFGLRFQSNLLVLEGMVIRPSVFRGWVYRVTQEGRLPLEEPVWWSIDGENAPRLIGTARLQAARYYRPLALGPVNVEMF